MGLGICTDRRPTVLVSCIRRRPRVPVLFMIRYKVAQRGAIVYKESATSISSTKSQARPREALCLQSIPVVIFHRLAVMPPMPSRTESVVGAMIVSLTPVRYLHLIFVPEGGGVSSETLRASIRSEKERRKARGVAFWLLA